MQFSAILLPMAFSLAAAQYGDTSNTSSDSGTATSSAAPTTFTSTTGSVVHKVAVGKNGLEFTPNTTVAAVGDVVEFHFYPTTHSVGSAAFASPCAPLNASSFFSGGFTTTTGSNATVFSVTINDTKPIWLYCGFPGHCQKGMVGAINLPAASTNKTLELFAKAAADVKSTTTVAEAQGGTKGAAASPASGTSSGTSTGTSTSSSSSSTSSKSSAAMPLKATMGGVAGFLSLAFAGLIM